MCDAIVWTAWMVQHAEVAEMTTRRHSRFISNRMDCRPEFIDALNVALRVGNEWTDPIPRIESPFVNFSKADLVTIGHQLGVSFGHTYSCYVGGEIHCGSCGTCTERIEAFRKAGIEDPTVYDPEGLIKYNLMQSLGSVA